jgi:N-acetylneuraminic acid mutarotase
MRHSFLGFFLLPAVLSVAACGATVHGAADDAGARADTASGECANGADPVVNCQGAFAYCCPRGANCAPPSCGADAGAAADVDASPAPLPHSVVLFGGDGPTFFTDTWEWDGANWLERNVVGPPPRYGHAMAGLGDKVILFGGQGESGTLGDTWRWDGTAWTQLKIPGPTPRSGHQMTTVGDKIVLFGGQTASGIPCDTWEFDGTSWTSTGATLTTGLHCIGHSIAALNGVVYLFGGVGAESDTWAYDGTTWTEAATTGPVGRAWAAMATTSWCCTEQPPPASIILFGGQVNSNDILSDTWQWDGTMWEQLAASGMPNQPPPRWDPGIALFQGSASQQGLVLFGGAQGIPPGGWLGDTWLFGLNGMWTQTTVSSPPARQVYTMAGR